MSCCDNQTTQKEHDKEHVGQCPECGCDDIDEFEDGIYENYITMPTEWKFRQTESWLLICKLIWKKIRRQK